MDGLLGTLNPSNYFSAEVIDGLAFGLFLKQRKINCWTFEEDGTFGGSSVRWRWRRSPEM